MLKALLMAISLSLNGAVVFSHSCEEQFFNDSLYPSVKAREEGLLKVSNLHTLFYAVYGNPSGIPVVILHGWPGGGCDDSMAQFFDPNRWNIIMFDQRGAMRSEPFGCLEENSTQHLISDIESLRKHLGIEKWMVFGGSWGSSLGLLYGQEHPDRCIGFVLRGIWFARESDWLHLFYGMGKIFPEAYAPLINHIPEEEREDLFSAYHRRIFDSDPGVQLAAARIFMRFDAICSTHHPNPEFVEAMMQNDKIVLSVSKAFCHYAKNRFFLEPNQILSRMQRIAHLPAIIVQGRYDAVCPSEMAYSLHQNWNNSKLWMIPDGGHSDDESSMAAALVSATDLFAEALK